MSRGAPKIAEKDLDVLSVYNFDSFNWRNNLHLLFSLNLKSSDIEKPFPFQITYRSVRLYYFP